MKHYKTIYRQDIKEFTEKINELAKEGYEVVSSNSNIRFTKMGELVFYAILAKEV